MAHAMSAACSTINGLGAQTVYTNRFLPIEFQAGETVSVSFSDNGAGAGGSPAAADMVLLSQYNTTPQYRYTTDVGAAGSYTGSVDSSFLTANGLYLRIKAGTYLSPVTVTCSSGASNVATLSGLAVSAGTLTPAFAAGTQNYSVSVANGVAAIDVTPTVSNAGATLTVNGASATSGAARTVPLNVGTNAVSIVVTAQDGVSTQTYQLSVDRAGTPLVANGVAANVAQSSSGNPISLAISGGAATGVAVATPPGHGVATASGTTITYSPQLGYAGPDSFTYTASNGAGTSAPATVSIMVNSPTIAYAPTSPSGGKVGMAYGQSVAAAGGGTAPYTYTAVPGSLPPGLTLSPGGMLSGTPTAAGSFSFSVTATDSSTGAGPFSKTSGALTLVVATPTMAFNPGGPTFNAVPGQPFTQTFGVTGGTAPYTYALSVLSGAMPTGVSFNATTGTLSGTPTSAGSVTFAIIATDSSTGSGSPFGITSNYTLNVAAPTVTVGPGLAPTAMAGVAYNQTVTASGGSAPYTFTITAGVLPAGLSLSAGGALTGTPKAVGPFNFTITATDANGFTGSRAVSLTVASPIVTMTPPTVPAAAVGSSYSQTLVGGGGNAPYTFALASGALPPGLALGSNGLLSGTPSAGGSYSFTVEVRDSTAGGPFATMQSFTMTVGAATLAVSPPTLNAGTVGIDYAQPLTTTGGTPGYTYAVTAGALPAGMSLSSGGTLSGRPTAGGTFNFTVVSTDSSGGTGPFSGVRGYTLTIAAPTLAVAPATLPAPSIGVPYSQTLSTSGGTGPYSYAITAGALPVGMSMSSGGVLSGTPTAGGTFNFTVTTTDSSGGTGPFSMPRSYTLTIGAATVALSPTTIAAPTVGVAYNQTFSASGGVAPYTFSVTGALPAGLTLSSSGVLSGTPTAGGSFNFTVRATDSSGGAGPYSGSQAFAITIGAPTLALNPASLPAPTVGTAYSQTVTASGGVAPYTYAISAGALPAGLTLDAATGAIRGTPTASGASAFTVRAVDSSTGVARPTASRARSR